jgi:hypothetical protein
MARPLRVDMRDGWYHATVRGNEQMIRMRGSSPPSNYNRTTAFRVY